MAQLEAQPERLAIHAEGTMKRIALTCLAVLLTVAATSPASAQSGTDLFQQALRKEQVDGDLKAAIALYQRILREHAADRALSAKTLVQLGQAYEKMGNADARSSYQRVIRDYADQSEQVAVARARLGALSAGATLAATTEPTVRRIWSGPDVDPLGGPTRDGRLLTFVDWSTGDLAVRDLSTGEKRRLTNKGSWASLAFALFSVPSPDGRRVAYSWYPEQGPIELRLIGINGGESRVLYATPEVEYLQPFAWSPDGKEIVAEIDRKDHVSQIVFIGTTDGSVRAVKTLDWHGPGKMSLSPDGKYLAFDSPPREDSPQRDIYVLATDGSSENVLVRHSAQDIVMGWAPDGRHVLFASNRTGNMSVWLAPVSGGKPAGEPVIVRRDAELTGMPLGFTQNGAFVYAADVSPQDMYLASIDRENGKATSAPVRMTDHLAGTRSGADWTRDGASAVYVSTRQMVNSNAGLLIIRSAETGVERLVPARLSYLRAPRWSPDGRYIAVNGRDPKGRPGIFRVDPASGEATMLVDGADRYFAGWSADARSIVYRIVSTNPQTSAIVRHHLDTGESQELVRVRGKRNPITGADVSSDGRQVAFASFPDSGLPPTLQVVSAEGGETRQLLRAPAGYEIGSLAWSADSRNIFFVMKPVPLTAGAVFISPSGKEKTRVMRVAATGGPAQETGVVMDDIQFLRAHPDGQRIGFVAGRRDTEVWIMENFLPRTETPAKAKQR